MEISPSKLDYVESAERVNTIIETSPNSYMGAIIFDDFKIGDDDLPENISYTIRYPIKTTMYVCSTFLFWCLVTQNFEL